MPTAVLDASAVIALVLRERGHDTVKTIVEAGAVVSATNMAEVLTVCGREGHRQTRDDLLADLLQLPIEVEPVTVDDCSEITYVLEQSTELEQQHPQLARLSIADATCLAVGRRLDLPVVVDDAMWELLDLGVQVLPFR